MSWLLDTCVLSEVDKLRPEPRVIQWLDAQPESSLFISALTIGEMQKGLKLLANREKQNRIERAIVSLLIRFAGRILSFDINVARQWGDIQATAKQNGFVLPAVDAFLAATALTHHLTFVTRNTDDLKYIRVPVLNPWL